MPVKNQKYASPIFHSNSVLVYESSKCECIYPFYVMHCYNQLHHQKFPENPHAEIKISVYWTILNSAVQLLNHFHIIMSQPTMSHVCRF